MPLLRPIVVVEWIGPKSGNSENSNDSDAQGPSTAETERSPILSPSYKALIHTAFNESYDGQVTTKHYMRRRKMKKAPFIQIQYTGVDILAMGAMMIEEEWRTDVIELFESARKVNKGREAVRKLVRHYIAKKHLQRSREEAMKLLRPLNSQEQSLVDEAMKKGDSSVILAKSGNDSVQLGSMLRLRPGKKLNDEIINYFLKNCLARRDEKLCAKEPGRRRSHFFNSFFVENL